MAGHRISLSSLGASLWLGVGAFLSAGGWTCHLSGASPDESHPFDKRILPLLKEHCFQCHSHDSRRIKGGLILDSYGGVMTGGDGGPVVIPGAPDKSRLLAAVRGQDPEFTMPPPGGGRRLLSEEAVGVLARWIEAGAAGPFAFKEEMASSPEYSNEARAWWAVLPIRQPDLPAVDDGGWSRNPIDAFIRGKLVEHKLEPAPQADRRTLIRRLSFDLLGVPPSVDEVEAFIEDPRPDAYELLVDRILDDPRYGERQARHWLDLVRFAESDGYKADHFRPHAWRYRDYVVRAFNADKPYDQFVREQLAGDELYPGVPDAIDATAFLRLGIYEYNNPDARGQWETILNDLTDITGDVFMGVGISCARCHDHKFDPILQKDYFRLQAFFAPIMPRDGVPVATPEALDAYQTQLAVWKELTEDTRNRIDALEKPYKEDDGRTAFVKFPEDVQALILKPVEERTPREHQIAELAYRQVQYQHDHIDDKIKGEAKASLVQLQAKLKAFEDRRPKPLPVIDAATDVGPVAPETRIPKSNLPPVEPGFLTLLEAGPAPINVLGHAPQSTGRRAALARWLTRTDNPLTPRVMANRLWQQHFGRGLAPSTSDFGKLGAPPSHPELLDWLAGRFIRDGWSLKKLHRLMVTSATYRQQSTAPVPETARRLDPSNRLLWRMPTRRLDAEQIRDALLAATGELSLAMGGPSVEASKPRRSIYTRARRNTHDALMEAFDQPDGINSTPRRSVTTTPTQALLMFNNQEILNRAQALAARAEAFGDRAWSDRIESAARHALGRSLESWEVAELSHFLETQTRLIRSEQDGAVQPAAGEGQDAEEAAFVDLCHVLLNANEFIYVD